MPVRLANISDGIFSVFTTVVLYVGCCVELSCTHLVQSHLEHYCRLGWIYVNGSYIVWCRIISLLWVEELSDWGFVFRFRWTVIQIVVWVILRFHFFILRLEPTVIYFTVYTRAMKKVDISFTSLLNSLRSRFHQNRKSSDVPMIIPIHNSFT